MQDKQSYLSTTHKRLKLIGVFQNTDENYVLLNPFLKQTAHRHYLFDLV